MMRRIMLTATLVLVTGTSTLFGATSRTDIVKRGGVLFDYHCRACHGTGIGNPGEPMKPGTAALTAKYNGAMPALLEQRTDLTPETIAYFVRNGVTVMAPYRKTEISDADLAAIGAYLSRNNSDLR